MEEIKDLNDAGDSLCRIQAKLSFLQTVLGGALYEMVPTDLTLNPDEQAGIYWIFRDLERDMSLVEKGLDVIAKKEREDLLGFLKTQPPREEKLNKQKEVGA